MASVQQLIDIGISRTHAYDILAEREPPSISNALKIYDELGEQFGLLKGLDAEAIEMLRANNATFDKSRAA